MNDFASPEPSSIGLKTRLEALRPLLKSKPFLAVAAAASLVLMASLIVSILLSRPLPKGRERLPELGSIAALDGFKLPDFPERFEIMEYARDPNALPDLRELASFVYSPGPRASEEARRLAREAVEAYFEGVQ